MLENIKSTIIIDRDTYLKHNPDIKNSGEGFINDFIKNYEKRVNYNLDYFISDDDLESQIPYLFDGMDYCQLNKEGKRESLGNWKTIYYDATKVTKEEFEKRFPGLSDKYVEQSLIRRMENALKSNDELEIEYIQQYRQLQEARKQLQDMS